MSALPRTMSSARRHVGRAVPSSRAHAEVPETQRSEARAGDTVH
jgi:hypothetical protein